MHAPCLLGVGCVSNISVHTCAAVAPPASRHIFMRLTRSCCPQLVRVGTAVGQYVAVELCSLSAVAHVALEPLTAHGRFCSVAPLPASPSCCQIQQRCRLVSSAVCLLLLLVLLLCRAGLPEPALDN
jgi:hypothetical protein